MPYKEGDYIVVPRGTTYRFEPRGRAALPRLRDAGADRDPAPLPQPVRADHRRRAVLPPRHPSADRAADGAREGRVPGQGARARRLPDVRRSTTTRSTSSAGTATSIRGRSRSTTSSRSPAASTSRRRRTRRSPGQNFVICSFCPRKLDFDPEAVPIPYHHSNLQSEEMIYYVSGNFGSRKGVEVGLDHAASVGAAARAAARPRGEVRSACTRRTSSR